MTSDLLFTPVSPVMPKPSVLAGLLWVALVSAAASVELGADGTIATARLALGSVAMAPWRLTEAEQGLCGLRPDAPEVKEVLEQALNHARPAGDSGYKVKIARGAARRALLTAAGVAP